MTHQQWVVFSLKTHSQRGDLWLCGIGFAVFHIIRYGIWATKLCGLKSRRTIWWKLMGDFSFCLLVPFPLLVTESKRIADTSHQVLPKERGIFIDNPDNGRLIYTVSHVVSFERFLHRHAYATCVCYHYPFPFGVTSENDQYMLETWKPPVSSPTSNNHQEIIQTCPRSSGYLRISVPPPAGHMCLETGGHDLADVARLGDLSQGWEDLTTGLAGRWLGRNIN